MHVSMSFYGELEPPDGRPGARKLCTIFASVALPYYPGPNGGFRETEH
jgi:hypothetical protein